MIGTLDYVSQSPNHKEETMRKIISVTVAFILMLILIGCATTSEQRKETYDMRKNVGNQPFVGGIDNYETRPFLKYVWGDRW